MSASTQGRALPNGAGTRRITHAGQPQPHPDEAHPHRWNRTRQTKKRFERPVCGTQNDFRGADDKFSGQPICAPHGRKKGGHRKTAARPFGIKRKSEVPIPRINPNRTNAREPGEDDRRARGLNSREHGPGHGKNQCFTLPSASGLCLYLKTSAKTTPTTRA